MGETKIVPDKKSDSEEVARLMRSADNDPREVERRKLAQQMRDAHAQSGQAQRSPRGKGVPKLTRDDYKRRSEILGRVFGQTSEAKMRSADGRDS